MSLNVIVSYDDTDNDRDAAALGRFFAGLGAELSLAYVRHARQSDEEREALEESEAEALLSSGAKLLDDPSVPRHVIVHASTGDGLRELALREHADIVVFGSEYRTADGAVSPGTSAQRLLNSGPTAVAIAPANLRSRPEISVARIGVHAEEGDDAALETARSLAETLGASIVEGGDQAVDLLVVGSTAGTPGHVTLSASATHEIETASSPVLAVPHRAPVSFGARAAVGAQA